MVAFCARTSACADNEICTVESEIVGNVVEGIYVPSAIPLIDDAFAEEVVDRIFVMTGGFQGEKVVEELSATSASRLNTLSESITKFGINWNYPSDQVG